MTTSIGPVRTTGQDAMLSELLAFRSRHSVPALGAALVTRDGDVVAEVVGVRVRDRDDPVLIGDSWHLGSCGKAITALLWARLVERGDTEWGARLPDLFPDLAPAIHAGWWGLSIDDVFVSQAGLPANLDRDRMLAAYRDSRPVEEQRTDVAATALARPPRTPGRFLYSNLGYIVVGAAVERITGVPYEDALDAHVLEPLGISSTGFGPPGEVWGHGGRMLALGSLVVGLGRGAPAEPWRAESDNPPVMSPAGRLHLTLEDWARIQRVFLGGRGDFLRPETIDRLLTPAPGKGYRQAFGWASARGLEQASWGQQGSNTFWVATALIDRERERTAMVVCNDGRARLMHRLPRLADRLLATRPGS